MLLLVPHRLRPYEARTVREPDVLSLMGVKVLPKTLGYFLFISRTSPDQVHVI